MDQFGRVILRTSLMFGCLVSWVALPAWGQQPSVAGSVKSVAGAVFIVRGGQQLPAAMGQSIVEADTLRTGADGRLGVTLKDGTRLSLGGNSEVHLTAFAYSPAEHRLGIVLKVLRGVTSYISGRIAELAPGAVKIETPTSVIGIRGTHLLIGVDLP